MWIIANSHFQKNPNFPQILKIFVIQIVCKLLGFVRYIFHHVSARESICIPGSKRRISFYIFLSSSRCFRQFYILIINNKHNSKDVYFFLFGPVNVDFAQWLLKLFRLQIQNCCWVMNNHKVPSAKYINNWANWKRTSEVVF